MSLRQLKVGDKVYYYGFTGNINIATIYQTTKMLIICDSCEFNRDTGRETPHGKWFTKTIRKLTPKIEAAYKHQVDRQVDHSKLKHLYRYRI